MSKKDERTKVYVVTQGSYSDYRIARIFSTMEKAQKYRNGISEANDVEIHTLDDDIGFENFTMVTVCSGRTLMNWVDFTPCNTLEHEKHPKTELLRHGDLYLRRYIDKSPLSPEEQRKYEEKYKKVYFDMQTLIRYLQDLKLTREQINEILARGPKNKVILDKYGDAWLCECGANIPDNQQEICPKCGKEFVWYGKKQDCDDKTILRGS